MMVREKAIIVLDSEVDATGNKNVMGMLFGGDKDMIRRPIYVIGIVEYLVQIFATGYGYYVRKCIKLSSNLECKFNQSWN